MQLRSLDDLPPSAPGGGDPAGLPPAMGEVDITIINSPVSRGPIDSRGPLVRDSAQAVLPTVESDPTTVDPAAPPVKVHGPDTATTSDASRVGDPTVLAAVENPLSASSGMTIPPATTAALTDATALNFVEGGFITLDDTSAVMPGFGSGQLPNTPNKELRRVRTRVRGVGWLTFSPVAVPRTQGGTRTRAHSPTWGLRPKPLRGPRKQFCRWPPMGKKEAALNWQLPCRRPRKAMHCLPGSRRLPARPSPLPISDRKAELACSVTSRSPICQPCRQRTPCQQCPIGTPFPGFPLRCPDGISGRPRGSCR